MFFPFLILILILTEFSYKEQVIRMPKQVVGVFLGTILYYHILRRIARGKLQFYNVFISIQFFNALAWESAAFISCHILTGRKWIPETGTQGCFLGKSGFHLFPAPAPGKYAPRSKIFNSYNTQSQLNSNLI